MEYARLGKSDLKVSKIGLGAWQFGDADWGWGTALTEDLAIDLINAALSLGMNFFDTAEVYGDGISETILGKALKRVRDDVVIATKVSGQHLRYNDVLKAVEGSLRRLQTDRIDLYQIHWPNHYVPIPETMKALRKLVKEEKVRYVGVSNFSLPELKEARRQLSIVSNQMRYNILQREIEKDLTAYARAQGVAVIAFSPLAQGLLTGKYSTETLPTDKVRAENLLTRPANMERIRPLLGLLESIATRHSARISQVALAWLLNKRNVFPIPGAKTKGQLEENIRSVEVKLTRDEIRKIDKASASMNFDYF